MREAARRSSDAVIVYQAGTPSAGRNAPRRARNNGAVSAYPIDRKMPNTDRGLPPYRPARVAAIRAMNQPARRSAGTPPTPSRSEAGSTGR